MRGDLTIDEAKAHVELYRKDGVTCPVCGRLVKEYHRKLHAEMASFLIGLVRKHKAEGGFIHVRELNPKNTRKASTDASYLQHWALVVKGDAGYYKPTEDGIDFALGLLTMPKYVHLVNNEVVGWSEEQIDIRSALEDKFNYDELMGRDW